MYLHTLNSLPELQYLANFWRPFANFSPVFLKHHPFVGFLLLYTLQLFLLPCPYIAEKDELIPTWEESSGGGEA